MNFIKKITIKNFFSIKNEVTLDLKASEYTKKQHPYRLFKYQNEYFNKLSVLCGANASGKTTILKALVFVSYVISNKNEIFQPSNKNIYNEFNETSFIKINFIFENQEYFYKIHFLTQEKLIIGIEDERLEVKKESNRIILIDRKNRIFKDFQENKIKGILFDEVSTKKSLLVESLTRIKDYHKIVNFFDNIPFLSNIKGSYRVDMSLEDEGGFIVALLFSDKKDNSLPFVDKIANIDKQEFHNFIFPILKAIGLDINSAESEINKTKDKFQVEIKFSLIHTIDSTKKLDFLLESNGTKMLFKILLDIFYAYKTKSILIIDELDSILHPVIVPIINLLAIKNDIQLIYSTHNINNMKYLYSDEIFLIEKDKNHITKIKDIKKDYKGYENFEKLYQSKQLGAIPKLENISLDMLVIDK